LSTQSVYDELPSSLLGLPADVKFYKWVKHNGVDYKPGYLIKKGEEVNELPQMSTITHLYSTNAENFSIVKEDCPITSFNEDYHCFTTTPQPEFTFRIFNIKEFLCFPTTITRITTIEDE
jgi:hypothetical protein